MPPKVVRTARISVSPPTADNTQEPAAPAPDTTRSQTSEPFQQPTPSPRLVSRLNTWNLAAIEKRLNDLLEEQRFWEKANVPVVLVSTVVGVIGVVLTFAAGFWPSYSWLNFIAGSTQIILLALNQMQAKFRTYKRNAALEISDMLKANAVEGDTFAVADRRPSSV